MNTEVIKKIYHTSVEERINPYKVINWLENIDPQADWFMSPHLISLYGTDYYFNLSETQQKQLSFWESVNFFSLNIHGEKSLIAGLAHRLYQSDNLRKDEIIDSYIHVFLAEENQHMSYFGGFCNRYAKGPYQDKKVTFIQNEFEPGEDDFLFFVKVLIFEEIVDVYNRIMAANSDLHPIVRQINHIHHQEEVRHLIFGRQIVESLFEQYSPKWSIDTLKRIQKYISSYLALTWAEYYNPDVYKDANFKEPFKVRQEAYNNPVCQQHRQKTTENCISFLRKVGILENEPVL